MDERLQWNAFKKKARLDDPVASKVDYRYYERLNAAYKAQRDSVQSLDRWLKNGVELRCTPNGGREGNQ